MANIFQSLLKNTLKTSTFDLRVKQSLDWYHGCIKQTQKNKLSGAPSQVKAQESDNLKADAPQSKKDEDVEKQKEATKEKATQQEEDGEVKLPTAPVPGWLFVYVYDAKWKNKLPYWDAFPLVLVLQAGSDRFLGLNFHYLNPYDRATLFDQLYRYVKIDPDTSAITINISYETLRGQMKLKQHKPCIKEYLYDHVKGGVSAISPKEWDIAMFLPTENFQKQPKEFVWNESKRIMDKK